MGERASAAGRFFDWRPRGVGRRELSCSRCDARTPVALLENLLEVLCARCGRNLAVLRVRALEEAKGAEGLSAELVELGVLSVEQAEQALAARGERLFSDHLLDEGLLRKDLRLSLELDPASGTHSYTARSLRELVLGAEVERALAARRERGGLLADLLREEVLARLGATVRSVGADVGLEQLGPRPEIVAGCAEALPTRALEIFRALPVRRDGEALVVALWDPLDFQSVSDLEALLGGPVHAILAEPKALEAALADLGVGPAPAEAAEAIVQSMDLFEEQGDDPLFSVLMEALEEGAAEVLVEPRRQGAGLRFRVRGELRQERRLDPGVPSALVERLDALGGARPTQGRVRGGSVRCEVSGLPVTLDYRVVETPLGPSVALELDEGLSEAADLGRLGLSLEGLATLEELFARRAGVVVVAAPTRAAIAPAYQALMQRSVRLGGVVVSLEDRPGVVVEGTTQLELTGLEPAGLRRVLSPLPDWLGVDSDLSGGVLEQALDVALRGSGVVLTVRAPDAERALLRLELAGAPRRLLDACVRAVLARRVVRRICSKCRVEREGLGWVGLGCSACADLGTVGWLPLAELVRPSPAGLVGLSGSQGLTDRALTLVQGGEVARDGVSDLLEGRSA